MHPNMQFILRNKMITWLILIYPLIFITTIIHSTRIIFWYFAWFFHFQKQMHLFHHLIASHKIFIIVVSDVSFHSHDLFLILKSIFTNLTFLNQHFLIFLAIIQDLFLVKYLDYFQLNLICYSSVHKSIYC